MSAGIYFFQFGNGKQYVGQSNNIEIRIAQHLSKAKSGSNDCSKFYAALRKYNYESNIRTILLPENIAYKQENLDILETCFIELYNTIENGYNLKTGGSYGKHSKETKEKMSRLSSGRKHSPETKEKISKIQIGKKLTDEWKEKIRDSHMGEKNHFFGKHHSEETKKKISELATGRRHSPETKEKISKLGKGRRHTAETREKISKSQKGREVSQETREKLSKAFSGENHPNFGKELSQETKDKISLANKGKKRENLQGELNPASKLTWKKVAEIRNLYKEGNISQRNLAKMFEVSQITIFDIIKYNLWKEEPEIPQ